MWSVSGGIQDEGKTVDSPKQLTVTLFFITFTQLIKLIIPIFLVLLVLVLEIEIEPNFFELLNSIRIHFAVFEGGTLFIDPSAQWRVFLVFDWNIACDSGRDICSFSVGIQDKEKRSTAQNNSQWPCLS
jgi:hypothetical protein